MNPPVILVPGITASDLHDAYQLPPEAVWTTIRTHHYERITLHPDDQRYESTNRRASYLGARFR